MLGPMIIKHSWKLFTFIGTLGLVASIAMMIEPTIGLSMLAGVSPTAPSGPLDPFTAFSIRWTATALFGCNALTIAIAATAFRRGERWAGVALSYWPLMFASHLLMYRWSAMSVVQVAWIALTVPALAVHFGRARETAPVRSAAAVAG